MALTLDSKVAAEPGIAFTEVQGELTLLDPRSGVYYGLNRVGTFIWRAIPAPVTLREVTAKVVERFEVERERCEADVLALMGELVSRGLVKVSG